MELNQGDLFAPSEPAGSEGATAQVHLAVVFDVEAGGVRFFWSEGAGAKPFARGFLGSSETPEFRWCLLRWVADIRGQVEQSFCGSHASSVSALMRRIRKGLVVSADRVTLAAVLDRDFGELRAGQVYRVAGVEVDRNWTWLNREVGLFARQVEALYREAGVRPQELGRLALRRILEGTMSPHLADQAAFSAGEAGRSGPAVPKATLALRIILDFVGSCLRLEWSRSIAEGPVLAAGVVRCTGSDELTYELSGDFPLEVERSTHHRSSIRAVLRRWGRRFPVAELPVSIRLIRRGAQPGRAPTVTDQRLDPEGVEWEPWGWVEDAIVEMAEQLRPQYSPLGRMLEEVDSALWADLEREGRWLAKRERKQAAARQRLEENMRQAAEERRRRKVEAAARRAAHRIQEAARVAAASALAARVRTPVPPVGVNLDLPPLVFQQTLLPCADLRAYFLRERAALWWVANQSDDLLCLPHCRIERLEYQLRTALRVLGPLRGRALLSDEVGLGKTIEAGLVLKELLLRGMVRRYLVLTVPSLVDQWAEELSDKFGLEPVTSNQAEFRSDPAVVWREAAGVVASLHTLKQSAHLEVAAEQRWDLLVVDEAHYLRNRESQAWQAVNVLPRRFLLLLTATPVQNSLEELYNLVTLLQPGQLPSPKEFRSRFMDPKRPRKPREPEQLRRLLGQVMIRNTRANAGLQLPPRRAETVLFEPTCGEREFWSNWEVELRRALESMPASRASLWGRLLLQTAGSSPAAWRGALEKFPDRSLAERWAGQGPLEESWGRKCSLMLPLAGGEGGLVVFTQFLATQAGLARELAATGLKVFVIHGGVSAAERQPITEAFRRQGGVLILTHSGTEGRNLQFCHRLVNFDLPWNPMEIEQRIGRLHRLGQRHPVRIYNLVQAGTLQQHLLEVLQEKLNLFELVVGETGLILGERLGSDEFAEEVFRRWKEGSADLAGSMARLGDELAAARDGYVETRQLDETLFTHDYEAL